jgi:hypothetical protein
MRKQTELDIKLEALGHMAAECELFAADRNLTDRERIGMQTLANTFREDQVSLLRDNPGTTQDSLTCKDYDPDQYDDPLSAAHGIFCACIVSAIVWAVIIWALWRWL